MADMEILQKAVNAEAGSERFDVFIDAGFADIVCRRHELREWDHLDLHCEFLSVGEAVTAGLDGGKNRRRGAGATGFQA